MFRMVFNVANSDCCRYTIETDDYKKQIKVLEKNKFIELCGDFVNTNHIVTIEIYKKEQVF